MATIHNVVLMPIDSAPDGWRSRVVRQGCTRQSIRRRSLVRSLPCCPESNKNILNQIRFPARNLKFNPYRSASLSPVALGATTMSQQCLNFRLSLCLSKQCLKTANTALQLFGAETIGVLAQQDRAPICLADS